MNPKLEKRRVTVALTREGDDSLSDQGSTELREEAREDRMNAKAIKSSQFLLVFFFLKLLFWQFPMQQEEMRRRDMHLKL